MTTELETPRIATWLYGVLSATPAVTAVFGTRIYRSSTAPPDATYPLVLFHPLSVTDENCLGPTRAGVSAIYFVRGVALPGAYLSALAPGLNAIDAALWNRRDTQSGYRFEVVQGRGVQDYEDPPEAGVPRYSHLGREWELWVALAA